MRRPLLVMMLVLIAAGQVQATNLRVAFTPLDVTVTSANLDAATPPTDPTTGGAAQTCCNQTSAPCSAELTTLNLLFICPQDPSAKCADFTMALAAGNVRDFAICIQNATGARACSNVLRFVMPAPSPTPSATRTVTPTLSPSPSGSRTPTPTPSPTPPPVPTLRAVLVQP